MRAWRVAGAAVLAAALAGAAFGVVAAPSASAGGPVAYTVIVDEELQACQLSRVDLTNGELTPLSAPPSAEACARDLTVGPDGFVYGLLEPTREPGDTSEDAEAQLDPGELRVRLVQFDPTTGAVTASGILTGAFDDSSLRFGAGLAFDTSGALYVVMSTNEVGCDDGTCLYLVDPGSYAATLIGPSTLPEDSVAALLAIDCNDAAVTEVRLRIDRRSDTAADPDAPDDGAVDAQAVDPFVLAGVDRATGVVTPGPELMPPGEDQLVTGIDFDRPAATLYGLVVDVASEKEVGTAAAGPGIATVDRATGEVTLVVPIGDPEARVVGLAIAGSCQPPPAVQPLVLTPTFTG